MKKKNRFKKVLLSILGVFVFAFSFVLTNFDNTIDADAAIYSGVGLTNTVDNSYNYFINSNIAVPNGFNKFSIFQTPSGKVFYSKIGSNYNINSEFNFINQSFDGISFGDSLEGFYMWSNGSDTFYSNGSKQLYFNESTYRWPTVSFSGVTSFSGANVVYVNGKNFLFNGSNIYVLNSYTWSSISYTGLPSNRATIDTDNFFVFNNKLYVSVGVSTGGSVYTQKLYLFDDNNYSFVEQVVSSDSFLVSPVFSAYNLWYDDFNTYYTVNNDTYVLNDDLTYTLNNFYGSSLTDNGITVDGSSIFTLNGIIYLYNQSNNKIYTSNYNIYNLGYNNGYSAGYNAGYIDGLNNSSTSDSYDTGYNNGYSAGYNAGIATNSGYNNGYDTGYTAGYNAGYAEGNSTGYTTGYAAGSFDGYNNGYNAGLEDGSDYSFLGLIGAVIDAPIQAFTGLFDFELFGTNLKSFFLALFTACVIIVIVKICLGGK